jgi:ATP-binding cassette subfamily B protein
MVQKALNSLSQQHTTLVIAHRLSTIIDADNIIVLGKNGIQESGSHEQLLEARGEYFKLWQLQIDAQNTVNQEID